LYTTTLFQPIDIPYFGLSVVSGFKNLDTMKQRSGRGTWSQVRVLPCLFAFVLLAAPSVSTASPEGDMKVECKGAAAGQYGTKPVYVTLGPLSPATNNNKGAI